MAVTTAQVNQLRRMIAEPSQDNYSDVLLENCIERQAIRDWKGQEPTQWDSSTTPPSSTVNPYWIPTYDLNAAAAEIWLEKAAQLADRIDLLADGSRYSSSQLYEHAQRMARFFLSRRAKKSQAVTPNQLTTGLADRRYPSWVGNLPEVP